MSYVSTYQAHLLDNLTQGQKAVITAIATFERAGKCWPSVATLAKRASMGIRTVQRHLAALINLGYITRTYRQGHAAVTRLFIGETPAKLAPPPPPNWHPESGIPESVNQIPAAHEPATTEPQHQHASIAVSPPSFFIQTEQPEQPAPAIQDLAQPANTTTEATKTPVEPSNEPEGTNPPTDTATPAVEADPLPPTIQGQASEADPLAEVPAQLLVCLGEVRKAKKRPAKVTKTEAALWWTEAQKAGWTMQQVITTMILHGWARFQADWVQHVPPQTAPGASAPSKVWQPEPHTPASASTLAKMREQIAQMKARWREEPLKAPPIRR